MTEDFVTPMRPRIVSPTPEQNDAARQLCRTMLDTAVLECANSLRTQPLAIKALMGRLLIEDFAALDVAATRDWLRANETENNAHAGGYGESVDWARARRVDAFDLLAKAQIAREAWS